MAERIPRDKPILCLDFDGVLHSYTSGWHGVGTVKDEPVPGALEAVEEYVKAFHVAVFSSRSYLPSGVSAMQKYLKRHGFPVSDLRFPTDKPPSRIGLDDRVMTFNGTFPSVEELMNFQPWYKQLYGVNGRKK